MRIWRQRLVGTAVTAAAAFSSHAEDLYEDLESCPIQIQLQIDQVCGTDMIPSLYFPFEKGSYGPRLRFGIDSLCPIISVKVVFESEFEGQPDRIIAARSLGDGKFEAPIEFDSQPYPEFMALQVIAVADSGDSAAITKTILVPTEAYIADIPLPARKKNWWARALDHTYAPCEEPAEEEP